MNERKREGRAPWPLGCKLLWPVVSGRRGTKETSGWELDQEVAEGEERGACQTGDETQRDLEAEGYSGLVHREEVL